MTSAIAKEKGLLSEEEEKARLQDMRHLPEAMRAILEKENEIKEWASVFAQKNNALFLGRGMHYPIALEGASEAERNQLLTCRRLSGRRT